MKTKDILLGLLHSRKYYEEEVGKTREIYYKQFGTQPEADLSEVPVPGIIGELKGESGKRRNRRNNKC